MVPRQVPLFEGGSRSGSTEPGGRFSVETEAQAGGMDVEPSDGILDLGSVWQSGGGPLCFSRVIPVPALVLPEFPDDSRHRCVRPPMAECQSVRVSANKADSGSTMQSEGERCPSPSHSPILALPDLVLGANSPLVSTSLGDSDQAGLTVPASGQDLASSAGALEVVGMAHTGPFGSCPDTSFYSMFGPLQARPSCLCRYLPQAVGPYGSSLPCVAPVLPTARAVIDGLPAEV